MLKVESFEIFISVSWEAVAYIISEGLTFKMSAHQKAKIKKKDNSKLLWEEFPYIDIGSVIGSIPLKKLWLYFLFTQSKYTPILWSSILLLGINPKDMRIYVHQIIIYKNINSIFIHKKLQSGDNSKSFNRKIDKL